MQGISVCDSVSSPHGTNCRLACVARNDLRLFYKINLVSRGAYAWRWCAEKLHTRTNGRNMNTAVRTNARWLFGGDGGSSNNNAKARLERSESANEDILIFYFQLDLQTRIQVSVCFFTITSPQLLIFILFLVFTSQMSRVQITNRIYHHYTTVATDKSKCLIFTCASPTSLLNCLILTSMH